MTLLLRDDVSLLSSHVCHVPSLQSGGTACLITHLSCPSSIIWPCLFAHLLCPRSSRWQHGIPVHATVVSQCWHIAVCLTTLSKKLRLASQTHVLACLLHGSILRGGSSISVHSPVPQQCHIVMQLLPVCQPAMSVPGHSTRMPVCIAVIQRDCHCGSTHKWSCSCMPVKNPSTTV